MNMHKKRLVVLYIALAAGVAIDLVLLVLAIHLMHRINLW